MARSIHNWLVYHLHDRALRDYAGRYFHGRLLDIGCGTKPYAKLLEPFITSYVGVDRAQPFNENANVDVVAEAYDIPLDGDSFDAALSSAALEHLAEPELALRECWRLLKRGGLAIYTVPFFWHIHAAPWDYYRFTKFGLQYLFEKAGFEVVEIKALSGFWVTFGQLFSYYLMRFNKRPLNYLRLIPALTIPVQVLALLLDKIDKAEDWTWMYLVVAKKPE